MESADRDIGEREAISAGETRRNIGAVGDIITGLKNKGKTMHFEHENGPFLALIGPFLAQIIVSQKSAFVTFLHSLKGNLLQKIRKIQRREV